ncbi:hypothetical protein GCM10009639_53440 [Kitasatospora putterlickiae]|uniref:Uncharacterized protein n=1 Tax=Kitasatospora putterlickiae TaxID=221725 RepID=A0ABN1YDL9_9ACTN
MGDGRGERRVGRGLAGFRVPCPCCSSGVRTQARKGLRAGRTGTGYVPETCRYCQGRGWRGLTPRD